MAKDSDQPIQLLMDTSEATQLLKGRGFKPMKDHDPHLRETLKEMVPQVGTKPKAYYDGLVHAYELCVRSYAGDGGNVQKRILFNLAVCLAMAGQIIAAAREREGDQD